jgi:hypothetical protein
MLICCADFLCFMGQLRGGPLRPTGFGVYAVFQGKECLGIFCGNACRWFTRNVDGMSSRAHQQRDRAGFAGATMKEAIRYGVARGLFSNESGLGSAPIVSAATQTKNPVCQALGSVPSLPTVWSLADITNGLMAIPNLISLVAPKGVIVAKLDAISGVTFWKKKKKRRLRPNYSVRDRRITLPSRTAILPTLWSFR